MTSYVAIIEERPSGWGPIIWVGELRTEHDDQPVPKWRASMGGGGSKVSERKFYGAQPFYPVTFGNTQAAVLTKLTERATAVVESATVTPAGTSLSGGR